MTNDSKASLVIFYKSLSIYFSVGPETGARMRAEAETSVGIGVYANIRVGAQEIIGVRIGMFLLLVRALLILRRV